MVGTNDAVVSFFGHKGGNGFSVCPAAGRFSFRMKVHSKFIISFSKIANTTQILYRYGISQRGAMSNGENDCFPQSPNFLRRIDYSARKLYAKNNN